MEYSQEKVDQAVLALPLRAVRPRRRHWRKTTTDCGMALHFEALWEELLETVPAALDQVEQTLPEDFPTLLVIQILGGARRGLDRMKQERS